MTSVTLNGPGALRDLKDLKMTSPDLCRDHSLSRSMSHSFEARRGEINPLGSVRSPRGLKLRVDPVQATVSQA